MGNADGNRLCRRHHHARLPRTDVASTYANIITSCNLDGAAIPMIMNTDREAIALAVKTVVRVKPEHCRIVRIRNTLHLGEIQISQPSSMKSALILGALRSCRDPHRWPSIATIHWRRSGALQKPLPLDPAAADADSR